MNYITHVNNLLKATTARHSPLVMYGQNIAAGSCISGLTRGLKSRDGHHVLNTPNCENTLVGTGFGLMLNGISSIFLMKQQDFLLLGIDQLVNSYSLIRRRKLKTSFTIMNVVVDSGYEGPQSALNNFYDFCSVARVPGFAITNKHDAEVIIDKHLVSPGFRIIGVSQRLWRMDLLENTGETSHDENGEIFQYADGNDATIVCFNFSLPQGMTLCRDLGKQGVNASLFSVNAMLPVDWGSLLENAGRTKRVILLDDSKSVNGSYLHFIVALQQKIKLQRLLILTRKRDDAGLRPNADEFLVDSGQVLEQLGLNSVAGKPVRPETSLRADLEKAAV